MFLLPGDRSSIMSTHNRQNYISMTLYMWWLSYCEFLMAVSSEPMFWIRDPHVGSVDCQHTDSSVDCQLTDSSVKYSTICYRQGESKSDTVFSRLGSWLSWQVTLQFWRRKQKIPPKRCYVFTKLHGITFRNTVILIVILHLLFFISLFFLFF